ncbi:MAG: peptidoglycan-binding protein [Candidatus Paceibacterota bacterium]
MKQISQRSVPKKASGILTYSIIFSTFIAFGVLFGTSQVNAQDADLIRSLQNQIKLLQQQIDAFQNISQPTNNVGEITSNLSPGDREPQVRTLQQALNNVPGIQIAASGAGSPGNETDFFGSLTTQAVIAFQEKYRSEVLDPWNLAHGTGFVGQTTRQKLNEFVGGGSTPKQTSEANIELNTSEEDPKESNAPAVTGLWNEPKITRIEPAKGTNGDKITLYGHNFNTRRNTVMTNHTQPDQYQEVASKDGETLTFTLQTTVGEELEKQLNAVPSDKLDQVRSQFPEELLVQIKVVNESGESNVIPFFYKSYGN